MCGARGPNPPSLVCAHASYAHRRWCPPCLRRPPCRLRSSPRHVWRTPRCGPLRSGGCGRCVAGCGLACCTYVRACVPVRTCLWAAGALQRMLEPSSTLLRAHPRGGRWEECMAHACSFPAMFASSCNLPSSFPKGCVPGAESAVGPQSPWTVPWLAISPVLKRQGQDQNGEQLLLLQAQAAAETNCVAANERTHFTATALCVRVPARRGVRRSPRRSPWGHDGRLRGTKPGSTPYGRRAAPSLRRCRPVRLSERATPRPGLLGLPLRPPPHARACGSCARFVLGRATAHSRCLPACG